MILPEPGRIERIDGRAEILVHPACAERQLIQVGLARNPRACGPRASQARRVPFSHRGGRSQRPAAGRGWTPATSIRSLTASRTPPPEPGTRVMKVATGTTYRPANGRLLMPGPVIRVGQAGMRGYDGLIWPHHDGSIWPHLATS